MISQSIQNYGAKGTETQNFCSSCKASLLAICRHLHLFNMAVSPELPAVAKPLVPAAHYWDVRPDKMMAVCVSTLPFRWPLALGTGPGLGLMSTFAANFELQTRRTWYWADTSVFSCVILG